MPQSNELTIADAFEYIDTVKDHFQHEPDMHTYNLFLGIMLDFKKEVIDTRGVIERVSELFRGHRALIQGFSVFSQLPARMPQSNEPTVADDALEYINIVKDHFQHEPDMHTYNLFLGIMLDFDKEVIDTRGVIERVSELFRGHRALIQGFSVFLPSSYKMDECDDVGHPGEIRVADLSSKFSRAKL